MSSGGTAPPWQPVPRRIQADLSEASNDSAAAVGTRRSGYVTDVMQDACTACVPPKAPGSQRERREARRTEGVRSMSDMPTQPCGGRHRTLLPK